VVTRAATCTAAGVKTYTCTVCGTARTETIAATGHSYDSGKVTKAATTTSTGIKTYTCTKCGTTETESIAKLDPVPFTDVPTAAYYAEPVAWAVSMGITTGTSATTFEPNEGCTRSQVVTFLWRAAGKPEPTSKVNPFTDVREDQYYYKAVLWAAENGITTGTTSTTFSPYETCTRSQVVTFLWRYAGKPGTSTGVGKFTDIQSGAYYQQAVAWAVSEEITYGVTTSSFAPYETCSRGQVVTFLWRDLVQ
jgi:hypothetical protein